MEAPICIQEGFADVVVVVLEMVHESAFCLTYILFFASPTGDAINDVGTLARNIMLGHVRS